MLIIQIAPAIRQECEETQCAAPAKHFKHCSEKVEGGKGWEGEDCVEELFHLMHCVDVSTISGIVAERRLSYGGGTSDIDIGVQPGFWARRGIENNIRISELIFTGLRRTKALQKACVDQQ